MPSAFQLTMPPRHFPFMACSEKRRSRIGHCLDISGRRGNQRPEAGIKFCGRSFVPVIKFDLQSRLPRRQISLAGRGVFSSPHATRQIFGDCEFGSAHAWWQGVSSMASFQRLLPIERPLCPRCRSRMTQDQASATPDRKEIRIFECAKCRFMET